MPPAAAKFNSGGKVAAEDNTSPSTILNSTTDLD
jgi:hypothetical protein